MSIGHAPYGWLPDGVPEISTVGWVNTLKQYFRVPETQQSMNMFPDYMEGRHNKYSVYQQIMNALMLGIHDINSKLKRSIDSSLPQTFLPGTIDVIYSSEAPSDFKMVEYYDGINWIESDIQKVINHEEWWYGTTPNLLKKILTHEVPFTLLDDVSLERTLSIDNSLLVYPSGLYVTLTAVTDTDPSFINNIKDEEILPTVITIYGKDKYDTDKQESYNFSYPTTLRTQTDWKEIYNIDCTYWSDDINITIGNNLLAGSIHEDRTVIHSNSMRNYKSIFWNHDSTNLFLNILSANNVLDYHAGVKDIEVVRKYILHDEGDSAITDIQSILPSEIDDMLYVITAAGKLYGYSKLDNFSANSEKATQIKTPTKLITLQIEKESDKYLVTALLNKSEVNRKIIKYRFSIILEDDSRIYFNAGIWGTDEGYIDYPFKKDYGFVTPDLEYDSSFDEDLLFIVDVQADDGKTYTDALVVDSDIKRPLFAITLPNFNTDYQLSYSADNFLVLSDDSTYYKFELTDNTSIYDENENKIILKHKWENIRFKNEIEDLLVTDVNIVTHNITNSMDQWGGMLNLDRFLGERSYLYNRRLRDIGARPGSSTKLGLINAISRDLDMSPIDTIKLSHPKEFHLEIKNPNIAVIFEDELTKLTNGTSDPFDTFVTNGKSIISAIIANGIGGCVGDQMSILTGEVYRVRFLYTHNSGDPLRIRIVSNDTGDGFNQANTVTISASGEVDILLTVTGGGTTSHLQLGTSDAGHSINFSTSNISIERYAEPLNLFKFAASDIIGQTSINGIIQNVVDWLTSFKFTVTIFDTEVLKLPARCLMPYDNYEYFYNNMWLNATRIDIHIPDGAKLLSSLTLIDNYEFVVDEDALLAATDPSFTIAGDNTIVTNLALTNNDLVHYVVMHSTPTLRTALMAIHNIHESESDQFAPGYISSFAKDLISTVENTASHKWID